MPSSDAPSPERAGHGTLDPAALAHLLGNVSRYFPEANASGLSGEELIRRAVARVEAAQKPASETDLGVGLRAALALSEMRLDPATLAATLLVPVPGAASAADLSAELGADVASLAEGADRLGRVRWDRLDEERAETLRKMFLAMARDVRVVLVVLALRREQMLRLDKVPAAEARHLAEETLAVHAPLANRLGIWRFKWQLEDAAFRVLSPEARGAVASPRRDTRAP